MVIEKDRKRTEQLVVDAVGTILASEGFRALGVNRVAREAGVSKMLIYRYFGGLEGLVTEYGKRGSFWPDVDEVTAGVDPESEDLPEIFGAVMGNLMNAVRSRPQTLEILAWEISESNDLVRILEQEREDLGAALLERFGHLFAKQTSVDANALTGLFAGGINYIALRARHIQFFNGVPVDGDDGWQRFADTMRHVMQVLVESHSRAAGAGSEASPPRPAPLFRPDVTFRSHPRLQSFFLPEM